MQVRQTLIFVIGGDKISMKKCLLIAMFTVCAIGLTACGSIRDKVTQKSDTIEVGETFDLNSYFEVDEGVTVSLKNASIDTSVIGSQTLDVIISNGKKEEEKTFTMNVVDTQAPVIDVRDATIYIGAEFNAEELATVSDNSGEDISVTVKDNNVDTSTAGSYSITYTATDSSGNSSEKSAVVEVMSIDSPEDVMDIVDRFLTAEGLSNFKYNKNLYDAVFVTSPRLSKIVIDKGRNVTMYPEIYILDNIFSMSPDSQMGFGVAGIDLRFEFSDRTAPQSERCVLYANKITISSSSKSFTNAFSGIPELGDIETREYLSRFTYTLNFDELQQLETMLDEGSVTLTIDATNSKYDMQKFKTVETPYSFVYDLNENDIELLKETMIIYNYLTGLLGRYN